MPELPEVETVCRGLAPHVINKTIQHIIVRKRQLRWKIPEELDTLLIGQSIQQLYRRAKYLLFILDTHTLCVHLGMSGRLCIYTEDSNLQRHDHVDIILSDNLILRYNDPRRFGSIFHFSTHDSHPLLNQLGLEPLSELFTADYLYSYSRNKKTPIKSFIMNSKVVVGVGNIYASEALFMSNIHPTKSASELTIAETEKLVESIKNILFLAIQQGGTTLKDFVNSNGKPGYFSQQLLVYGRRNLPCFQCNTTLKHMMINQRSTVFCDICQY